jgi:hypothetical protein
MLHCSSVQVTIAVLLDNSQSASRKQEEHNLQKAIEQRQREKCMKNPLDPLLLSLSMDYASPEDLNHRLEALFKVRAFPHSVAEGAIMLAVSLQALESIERDRRTGA